MAILFKAVCRFEILLVTIKCKYCNKIKEKHNKHNILGKSEDNVTFVLNVKRRLICKE